MRLETGGQRGTGVRGRCLASAALDALRPREAGLGAAQPLVRSAPGVLAGEEAHGSWSAAPGPACGAGPTLARRSHSTCLRPGGLVTARSPRGWARRGFLSLSLPPPLRVLSVESTGFTDPGPQSLTLLFPDCVTEGKPPQHLHLENGHTSPTHTVKDGL